MLSKINLLAQRFENYNVGPEGLGEVPYWKPKGGHVFEVKVNFDWLMYADSEDRDKIFASIIDAESNDYEKFEYVEFELAPEVSKISTKDFNRAFKAHYKY